MRLTSSQTVPRHNALIGKNRIIAATISVRIILEEKKELNLLILAEKKELNPLILGETKDTSLIKDVTNGRNLHIRVGMTDQMRISVGTNDPIRISAVMIGTNDRNPSHHIPVARKLIHPQEPSLPQ